MIEYQKDAPVSCEARLLDLFGKPAGEWLKCALGTKPQSWLEVRNLYTTPTLAQAKRMIEACGYTVVLEKFTCDYCGNQYTNHKYCCQRRREYLNAHGVFEITLQKQRESE